MIKVDRDLIEIPKVLIEDNENENGEKKRAIKHFESEGFPPVEFKLYKEESIKDALEQLFNEKCAYCESKIKHASPFHIEHWRPKKKVTERKGHNGYYWLASEWDNLLLACPTCNTQHKKTFFPIDVGSSYAIKSEDDYRTLEKPLLVNPCETDPEKIFTYTRHGMITSENISGKKSIEVYGLFRSRLVGIRKKRADNVLRELDNIKITIDNNAELISQYNVPVDATPIKNNLILIDSAVRKLSELIEPSEQFAGLSRYIIKEYRKMNSTNNVFIEVTKALE